MPQFAVVIVDGTEPPEVCVFNDRQGAIDGAISVVESEFTIGEQDYLFIQKNGSFYDEEEAFSVDVVQLTHPEDFSRIYDQEELTVC
jgi:hypothetical protein